MKDISIEIRKTTQWRSWARPKGEQEWPWERDGTGVALMVRRRGVGIALMARRRGASLALTARRQGEEELVSTWRRDGEAKRNWYRPNGDMVRRREEPWGLLGSKSITTVSTPKSFREIFLLKKEVEKTIEASYNFKKSYTRSYRNR